ncbi:M48 family metallopeptidase [Parablastomonas sp. CN1-191]|uniref:M48 family metallopeptidase n=1 Tax=Parablastomonas sp. CN1-191 TaxID=3400908 RepID=UPI003BF88BBC
MWNASLFDGQSARRYPVRVALADDALAVEGPETPAQQVALADLVRTANAASLSRRGSPGWRLVFADGVPAPVAERLAPPARYGKLVDRWGLPRAAAAFAAVSAALAAAVMTAPVWLGPMVPQAVENRIGTALVPDFAGSVCHTPAGDAALHKLMAQIDRPGGGPPIRVQVVKLAQVNAAALPGGRIVVLSGLLEQAKGPDELAGVLAHEAGHVRERHVMQGLLRQFGLSILLSGASGTAPASLGQLTALRFSRKLEDRADRYALARLQEARISPAGVAGFFDRAANHAPDEGNWLRYVSDHPDAGARQALFRRAVRKGAAYLPALSPDEWRALSEICADDTEAKFFSLW